MSTTPRLLDLSHTVEDGMITYKGLPAPIICDYLSREASREKYAEGTEFQIGRIDMVANTGTYVDAPFHRYADGADLSELRLEQLANLDTVVVRAVKSHERAIHKIEADAASLHGKAVLVHTGWDAHWRTEQYLDGHPYLTGELAEWLANAGVTMVGIDSHNIDCTDDGHRPVHSVLLRRGIPICEHMTGLATLPDRGARFFAVPVKVKGMGTFPVRAFAIA